MKYRLRVYSIWEYGQRKDSHGNPHQEDNMFPEHGKSSDSDRLFILCDGMGGHDAGEVASSTVCEAMSRSILRDGQDNEGVFSPEDFSVALNAAFHALDQKDNGAEKKMGTTMTFLKLHAKGATIAHMGDSRVYHIRPGKTGADTRILFQTEDHSLVNDLVKLGELTEEEARCSRQRNVITRAMQPNMGRRSKADVHETSDIRPGDYFYMCSDGMLEQPEMDSGESLKNIFSDEGGADEEKVKILESVTKYNRDNHAALIIHILDVEDAAAAPAAGNASARIDEEGIAGIVENERVVTPPPYYGGNHRYDEEQRREWTEEERATLADGMAAATDSPCSDYAAPSVHPEQGEKTKNGLFNFVVTTLVAALVAAALILGYHYFM